MPDGREVVVGEAGARQVRIDFFPQESLDEGVARGRFYIYAGGEAVMQCEACGGPPPGAAHGDAGGHFAGATIAGHYVLGAREHHVTSSWPTSTIPWGARIRAAEGGEIEFSTDGARWSRATGPSGCVTRSWMEFEQRTRLDDAARQHTYPTPLDAADIARIEAGSRAFFYDDGQLMTEYRKNDFGVWAWNLMTPGRRGPERTAMYVHTTPADEGASSGGAEFELTQSHGCIHIRPADRDRMMDLGYLQAGVNLVVQPYGTRGP